MGMSLLILDFLPCNALRVTKHTLSFAREFVSQLNARPTWEMLTPNSSTAQVSKAFDCLADLSCPGKRWRLEACF